MNVVQVVPDAKIVLRWAAAEGDSPETAKPAGYQTTVTMTFEPLDDGRALVTIAESGWRETEAGLKACLGNCQGWSQMLCAMKVWVEPGINLRDGFYK